MFRTFPFFPNSHVPFFSFYKLFLPCTCTTLCCVRLQCLLSLSLAEQEVRRTRRANANAGRGLHPRRTPFFVEVHGLLDNFEWGITQLGPTNGRSASCTYRASPHTVVPRARRSHLAGKVSAYGCVHCDRPGPVRA